MIFKYEFSSEDEPTKTHIYKQEISPFRLPLADFSRNDKYMSFHRQDEPIENSYLKNINILEVPSPHWRGDSLP